MDRLFKKRATSSGGSRQRERANSHQNREKDKGKEKERDNMNALASPSASTTSSASPSTFRSPPVNPSHPPSIELDIRTSLILPSMSQRFSVLLPSLSAAPETSLRYLLASQRARPDGPSLTLEEEELLMAEIRGNEADDDWDGRPPAVDFGYGGFTRPNGYGLTSSFSSPSVLLSDASEVAVSASTSTFSVTTPPPTSTSFSSFHTFGEASTSQSPSPNHFYGGGGGGGGTGFGRSALRDGDYRRRVQRNATQRSVASPIPDSAIDSKEPDTAIVSTAPKVTLAPISPEKANASYISTKQALRADTPGSDMDRGNSPTPTPSAFGSTTSLNRLRRNTGSPSAGSTLNLPPQLPPPAGLPPPPPETADSMDPPTNGRKKQRQSMMLGMSAAQMKRVSRALMEIESQLEQGRRDARMEAGGGRDDGVEVMASSRSPRRSPKQLRRNVGNESDEHTSSASASAVSSVFPFSASPTHSSHARSPSASTSAGTPPASKPRSLPSSPRSHNLHAQVEPSSTGGSTPRTPQSSHPPLPPFPASHSPSRSVTPAAVASAIGMVLDGVGNEDAPRPALTPYRPQPVRHTPSGSISSTSQASSPMPGYVPGQVRPVGSSHRTNPSISSQNPSTVGGSPAQSSSLSASTSSPPTHMRSGSSPTPHVAALSTARANLLNRSPSLGHPRLASTPEPSSRTSALSTTTPVTPQTIAEAEEMESPLPVPSPTFLNVNGIDRRDSLVSDDSSRLAYLGHDDPRSASHTTSPTPAPATGSRMLISPPLTLRRLESSESMDSSYKETRAEENWADVFDGSSSPFDDVVMTPGDERGDAEVLRKYSGVGREELSMIQDRLVERAKLEREQLRSLDDPPSFPNSPGPNHAFEHANNSSAAPALSYPHSHSPPPTAWRFHQSNASVATSRTISPAGTRSQPLSPVIPGQAAATQVDTTPTGPTKVVDTPAEEYIHTPASTGSQKTASRERERERERERRRLDEDPEVRRDFEERIAAATAALHRTPSRGPKYDRKNSVSKRGALVISSPTLMSSSIHLPATPGTPSASNTQSGTADQGRGVQTTPGGTTHSTAEHDAAVARALEKASGSSTRMGMRWKKLAGFKKPPSMSNADPASLMPLPARLPPQSLEEPIALRHGEGSSAPANMASFRFPPEPPVIASPPRSADPVSNGTSQAGPTAPAIEPAAEKQAAQMLNALAEKNQVSHTPSSSEDSAVAQFLRAGRAVGLDEEKLQEMLVASGMLNRSGTTASSRSYRSTGGTSTEASVASPTPSSPAIVNRTPSLEKPSRSLFRVLSKNKRAAAAAAAAKANGANGDAPSSTTGALTPPLSDMGTGSVRSGGELTVDSSVVRRTMILSNEFQAILAMGPPATPSSAAPASAQDTPTTPQGSFSPSFSDNSNEAATGLGVGLGLGFGPSPSTPQSARKPSIKRKPLKLTGADRELVERSPSQHRRNPSGQTNTSFASDRNVSGGSMTVVNELEATPHGAPLKVMEFGLGFLAPDSSGPSSVRSSDAPLPSPGMTSLGEASSARVSSTGGGSFYDYYNNDNDNDHGNENDNETEDDVQDESRRMTSESERSGQEQHGEGGEEGEEGESVVMAPANQAVEITEYADGRVVWSIVDALRDEDVAQVQRESGYTYDSPHFSEMSEQRRESGHTADEPSPLPSRWDKGGFQTPGLQFRHRDRNDTGPRPQTKVFYTSSADVADLIDQLSRDTAGAARGRIDIVPSSTQSPRPTSESQFSDALSSISSRRHHQPLTPVSPARHGPLQPHHSAASAAAFVPAGGFSPKRQMFLRQHQNAMHRRNNSNESVGGGSNPAFSVSGSPLLSIPPVDSPSAASFFSDGSGSMQGRSVEDRLQALMDRLCVEPGVAGRPTLATASPR